jgi:hypothetical protein
MIGDALDTMLNKLHTYHLDLEMEQDQRYDDGSYTNAHLTERADVENPDQLNMVWHGELIEDNEASVTDLRIIRIGDVVYYRNSRTGNGWQQLTVEDIGEDYLVTVMDLRPIIASAQLRDDEDHDGVTAHHITFTLDMQKLVDENTDVSQLNAAGAGEIWIAADGGQLLEMKWHYVLEDPDSGATVEFQYDGTYSAFDQPVNIQPPPVQ